MKKLYTLSLAVAVALSTSAAQRQTVATTQLTLPGQTMNFRTIAAGAKLEAAGVSKIKKAPTPGATVADYTGTYDWAYENLLNGAGPNPELIITVTNTETGAATISGLPQDYVLSATFDLEAGTLTIPNKQDLGPDHNGDANYFYLKGVTSTGNIVEGASDVAATVGTIDGNKITFPTLDIWAIGDYNDETLGYWMMTYRNSFELQDPNVDPNEGWTSQGNATLTDGWLIPCFTTDDQRTMTYEVELQKKDDAEGVYRLVDPYHGNFPYAMYNTSTKVGYIQFNVSDPDHVTFEAVPAGFANGQIGVTEFYCLNTLSLLAGAYEMNPADVADILGDQIPYTTYKDGIVTLTSTEVDGTWNNDACFGIQNDPFGGYGWTSDDNKSCNMFAKIVFPGVTDAISNVTVSDSDAPVRYYNLQGVELAMPAAGSVVIRVQGDKAVKTIVK